MKPLWMPLVLCLTGALLIAITGADHAMTDAMYDPVTRAFPWRFNRATDFVLHRLARNAIIILGIWALTLSVLGRRSGHPSTQRVARMVLLSLLIGTSSVATVKALVNVNCPWNYTRYGGRVVEGSEWPPLKIGGHDHAFPAGHAAGGYSLMVLWLAGRRRSPAAARAGLAVGLAAGTVLGLAQVARGAHYVSHNLWTALICWYGAALADRLLPDRDASKLA